MGDLWGRLRAAGRRFGEGVKQHKIISAVLAAGFAALVGAFWTFVLDTASDKLAGDKPAVSVTVLASYAELGWTVGFPSSPPADQWHTTAAAGDLQEPQWAKRNGGAEVSEVRRRLVLVGGNDTVVIVGMHARVLQRRDPVPVVVDNKSFAALVGVSIATINLDDADPTAMKTPEEGAPIDAPAEPFFGSQAISLTPNEPQPIDVNIGTTKCDCDFELVLDLVVNGKQRQQTVRDVDGQPFRIAARPAAAAPVTGGYYQIGSCDPDSTADEALVWNTHGDPPAGDCIPLK